MSEKSKGGMFVPVLIMASLSLGVILPIIGFYANFELIPPDPRIVDARITWWVVAGVLFLVVGIALSAFTIRKALGRRKQE